MAVFIVLPSCLCRERQLAVPEALCQRLKGLALQAADPLAADPELGADRLQRVRLAVDAVPELENASLQLGKLREREPNGPAPQVLVRPLLGVVSVDVGEEVSELAVLVAPDRTVQGDARLDDVERLVDVQKR